MNPGLLWCNCAVFKATLSKLLCGSEVIKSTISHRKNQHTYVKQNYDTIIKRRTFSIEKMFQFETCSRQFVKIIKRGFFEE
jgi:hypothetical protein